MNAGEKFSSYAFRLFIFCVLALSAADVRADLKAKDARKAITRMAGFELTNGAVKVKTIANAGATTAEVTASIRSVFRIEKDAQARWRVAEIRTGPNSWEKIESIARALGTSPDWEGCNAPDPPARAAAIEPSVKRARCLLGGLFGIQIPSDAVRIQEVAPFAIPLASQPSTTVVAWIQVEARLTNDGKGGWKVTELRTGTRDWTKVDPLLSALNQAKQETARSELTTIAQALERFRTDRGSYLVSDKHAAAIDHLSPRYLARVIRLDPWKQPYTYQGQRDRFTLSSSGPDRKEATADDIVVTGPLR
jgi:hypothetical protein